MSTRKKNDNRRQRQPSQVRLLSRISNSLQSIDRAQTQEISGMLPRVPDQVPISIRADKVFSMWKAVDKGTFSTSTSVPTQLSYVFRLSDVNDATSLAAVFDEFTIRQVVFTILPLAIGSNTSAQAPIESAVDVDDASVILASSQLAEFSTYAVTMVGKPHVRVFRPQAVKPVYNGAFTAYSPLAPNEWVDSTYTNTDFYALKVFSAISSTVQTYAVKCNYLLQFRRPH